MADNCFDVWISNARGNTYSHQHKKLKTSEPAYWNFTWVEIALYDYPAIYDYILNKTNCSKLFVVGHSQGTTTQFVLLSTKPEFKDKIAALAMMAPVTYLKYAGTPWQLLSATRELQEVTNQTIFK